MTQQPEDFFDDRGPFADMVRDLANRAGCLITLQHVGQMSPRDTARVMLDVLAHVRAGVGEAEDALTRQYHDRTRPKDCMDLASTGADGPRRAAEV